MALPKISTPTYSLVQPSTKKKLTYRPFLVKEEKILLTAKESGDSADVFNAIKQIINNCVIDEKFDVDTVPIFDMEYIFIKIRSSSVGNVVKFKVTDSDDGIEYDLEVDLEEVEVIYPEGDNKIQITDELGLVMKYLTPSFSKKLANLETVAEITEATILESIDYVYDADNVYPWNEHTTQEKKDFLEQLTIDAYKNINKFFDSTPRLNHEVFYENSTGKKKKVVFRKLDDFFILD